MSSIDLECSSIDIAPTESSSVYSVNEGEERITLRPVFTDADSEVIVNAIPVRPPTPVALDIAPFEFEDPSALDPRSSPKVLEEIASSTDPTNEALVTTQDAINARLSFLRSSTANSREAFEQNVLNAAESTGPGNIFSGVSYFQPLRYVWNLACRIGQADTTTGLQTAFLSSDQNPLLGNVAPEPIVDEENFDNEDASTEDSWYEVDELANKFADTSISEQVPIRLFPERDIVEEPESYVEAANTRDPAGSPTDSPADSSAVAKQDRYQFGIEMSPDEGKIVETVPVPSAAELAQKGYYSNRNVDYLQALPSHTSTRRGALIPPSTIFSPYCPLASRPSDPSPTIHTLPLSSTVSSATPFQEVNYNTRRTVSLTSSPPSPRNTGKANYSQRRHSLFHRLTSRKRKHSLPDTTDGYLYPPSTAYSSLSSRASWESQTTAEKSKQLCDRMIANSEAARRGRRLTKKSYKRVKTGRVTKS
ncbi:MAG: hypothetical protein LQ351_006731 [Letrouitia transgressa]|nr:MAG: hypothetical protein LQ351_006731 [Letrouitia transgressa]